MRRLMVKDEWFWLLVVAASGCMLAGIILFVSTL